MWYNSFMSKSIRVLFLITILALISNLFISPKMVMDIANNQLACVFDNSGSCSMDYQQHIQTWQSIFISNQIYKFDSILIFFVLILSVLAIVNVDQHTYQLYVKSNPDVKSFNYLISFFGRGLAQPKIYA